MFSFALPRARRKPGLTPLIDVVFLLLVFFMLAAQFGRNMALPISGGNGASDYNGPPRLVTILPDALLVNGQVQTSDTLVTTLSTLTETRDDTIVLLARDDADVQRLTDIVEQLSAAGFRQLVLAE